MFEIHTQQQEVTLGNTHTHALTLINLIKAREETFKAIVFNLKRKNKTIGGLSDRFERYKKIRRQQKREKC